MVVEEVGTRELWEPRCLKERQKLEIGDQPYHCPSKDKESYSPLAASFMKWRVNVGQGVVR